MKKFYQFILRLVGWKITGLTDLPVKSVICVAPHTSNWDLPLGLTVYKAMGRKAKFLIKKEWFFFPMNLIFNFLGGIPVDRSRKTSLTEQMAEIYRKKDDFQLAITPEATRKLNPEWKKGFYFIALAANVPIVVAALDYKKKEADFKKIIIPSGDADADIEKIKACYEGVTAKHPEYFSL
ncbi:MAG: 1-acyl-sn-glycerol-3-phosphate acyltransferase [Dysgonomonas sp.]|nr:1-acyl-sn-glycerol-3-phosphate acyltransferase [Dysgonomonas sp.]